jgi:DNA repair protein RecN (Recombination protein N)
MVEEVRIQGLGVIEEAVLDLSPGFNVVTGETGAGKTMVVTSLGLLFGGRADPQRVRRDAGRALIEGRIVVRPDGRVAERLAEIDGELDDGALIITRTVSAEGRSRAHAGGRSVPVSTLIGLADELVAVHGQSDQQRLLQPARQRESLDRYAGEELTKPLRAYTAAYRRHREVGALLEELTTRARERAQEADMLRFGLDEIEKADPKPGEDTELAAEEERLAHADALRTASTSAHDALRGDPAALAEAADAMSLIGSARQALEAVREHDPALAALADRLAEAGYLVSDVAGELAAYAESVEADPTRLAALQERRATLTGLTRKYGATVDDVLAWAESSTRRLTELEGDDERIDQLRAEHADLTAQLVELAGELTAVRRAAAERFSAAVTAELTALAMPHARVNVVVTTADPGVEPGGSEVGGSDAGGSAAGGSAASGSGAGGSGAFGPHGLDEVEIQLMAHPGAPPLPLHKGASGGELSRVMLAIEVVFAGADPVPTFVFDEVDAGVGGKAAIEIGRRLARLARNAQVIVVTHLAQVAAFADQHLVVRKSDDGSVTSSGVTALDTEGRVRELTRMFSGLEDRESGRAHAEELLDIAAAERSADAAAEG